MRAGQMSLLSIIDICILIVRENKVDFRTMGNQAAAELLQEVCMQYLHSISMLMLHTCYTSSVIIMHCSI